MKNHRSISLGLRPFGFSQGLCVPRNNNRFSDIPLSSLTKVAVGRKPSNVSQKRPQRRSSEVRFFYISISQHFDFREKLYVSSITFSSAEVNQTITFSSAKVNQTIILVF